LAYFSGEEATRSGARGKGRLEVVVADAFDPIFESFEHQPSSIGFEYFSNVVFLVFKVAENLRLYGVDQNIEVVILCDEAIFHNDDLVFILADFKSGQGQDNCLSLALQFPQFLFDDSDALIIDVGKGVVENVDISFGADAPSKGYLLKRGFGELRSVIDDGIEIVVESELNVQTHLVVDLFDL
jgi:hypothetical protein